MLHGHHARQNQDKAGRDADHRPRQQPGREEEHHAGQHTKRGPGASAKRHRLTAHRIRRIHHQHLRIGKARIKRLPGSLQQQRIARLQLHRLSAHILSTTLDGDDHKITAFGDHALIGGLADHFRTRRDHDFRKAGTAIEQAIAQILIAVLKPEGQILFCGQPRRILTLAGNQQEIALHHGRAAQPIAR